MLQMQGGHACMLHACMLHALYTTRPLHSDPSTCTCSVSLVLMYTYVGNDNVECNLVVECHCITLLVFCTHSFNHIPKASV